MLIRGREAAGEMKILIVDEKGSYGLEMAEWLKQLGHNAIVDLSSRHFDLMQLLRVHGNPAPDIVIFHSGIMSQGEARVFVQLVRQAWPAVKIIVDTAAPTYEGADLCILKPSPEDILAFFRTMQFEGDEAGSPTDQKI